jgi:hypothetical protein
VSFEGKICKGEKENVTKKLKKKKERANIKGN